MSQFPCIYCDAPIPESEATRTSLCPVCSRPLSVCGRFRLRSLLSKSEGDRVYGAVRDPDGLEVSVKILLSRDDDWAAQSEFERVARALQGIKSPALPQIHAWERGAQGRLILVRERFEGGTLEERGGQAPAGVLSSLLTLLSLLHKQSPPLLHRDIRREKILFRSAKDWSPVLVDFVPTGLATVETDLRALGAAFPDGGAVAAKLAAGGFASADEALRALHGADAPHPNAPPARVTPRLQPPRRPASPRRSWAWVVVALWIAGGIAARLARHSNTPAPPGGGDSTVEQYRRECDRGEALGCYNLGYRYEKGKGVAKDEARAVALYQKSCDQSEKLACNNLAVLYESGRGVAKDAGRAAQLYKRACDQSDWLACRNLGYLYSNGVGVAKDASRAAKLYQQACDHDDFKGCYNLAILYESGKGVGLDTGKAIELYGRACDGNDWEACTNLGWIYAEGKNVAVDFKRARPLYEKACNHADARACNNLGTLWDKGHGVTADAARALELYKGACDAGDYYGCSNLGYFYETGTGVTKDLNIATDLYLKSCKLGYDKGCDYFAIMCGDPRAKEHALALRTRACDAGDKRSCVDLPKPK